MALQQLRDRRRRTVGSHPPALQPAVQGQGRPATHPAYSGQPAQRQPGQKPFGPTATPKALASQIQPRTVKGNTKSVFGFMDSLLNYPQRSTTKAPPRDPKPMPGSASATDLVTPGSKAPALIPPGGKVASALQGVRRRRRKPRRAPTLPSPGPGLIR